MQDTDPIVKLIIADFPEKLKDELLKEPIKDTYHMIHVFASLLKTKHDIIENAIKMMDVCCSGCKDCDETCDWNKLRRLLMGKEYHFCSYCSEWVDEINEDNLCNECIEFFKNRKT